MLVSNRTLRLVLPLLAPLSLHAQVEVPSQPHLDYGPAATGRSPDCRHQRCLCSTGRPGRSALGQRERHDQPLRRGWSFSTIASLLTGFPFSSQLGYNPIGSGDSRDPVRPNLNPSFNGSLYTKGTTSQRVTQYFNPGAFSAPAYGTVGDVSRDAFTGPGYAD